MATKSDTPKQGSGVVDLRDARSRKDSSPGTITNLDAERAVIEAVLCTNQTPDTLASLFSICSPADFYDQGLGAIYQITLELHLAGKPITLPLIRQSMDSKGPEARWKDELGTLFAIGKPVGQYEHARAVRENATRRAALVTIRQLGYDLEETGNWHDHLGTLTELKNTRSSAGTLTFDDLSDEAGAEDTATIPSLLQVIGGPALFYPEGVHDIHGRANTGKTWIALYAMVEATRQGSGALFIDYEGTPGETRDRLRALGASNETRKELIHRTAGSAFTENEIAELRALVAGLNGGPVVIDSVARSMASMGLDENSNRDYAEWFSRLPAPLSRLGSPVILIDHVGKSLDRATGARGASAKRDSIEGSSYELLGTGFSRNQVGHLKLKISKDRHGRVGAEGEIAAQVTVTPESDGSLSMTFNRAASPISASGQFQPTYLMAQISEWAISQGDGFEFRISDLIPNKSRNPDAVTPVKGKSENLRAAVRALNDAGHLTLTTKQGSGYYSINPKITAYSEPYHDAF